MECSNGGNCQIVKTDSMDQSKEMCICSSQYYGDSCQFHASDCQEPCRNGGVCQWGYCLCTEYFTGKRCQIKIELCSKECSNGGSCQIVKTDSMDQSKEMCICSSQYYGDSCQFHASERCSDHYCLNGGTCEDDFHLFPSCLCPDGFRGSKCDEPEVEYSNGRRKHLKHLSPGNIAAIVIIVFATMGLSVGVRFFRKWKMRRIRDRRRSNQTLNNRAWIERSSPHSGVNFVTIPDFLHNQDHSPSPSSQMSTSPSDGTPSRSYSCSSTTALTSNQNLDNDNNAMATEDLPPSYDTVIRQNSSWKSNVRFQELNCRNLDES
ncbi:uncharacterized protein LOC144442268 [Glandiceps talaboti]